MLRHENVSFIKHNKQTAFWLSVFLGAFGIHRFYLHQHLTGFAYLLFCWTLIPIVLSAIDAVFLARMSDEEFQEEFNDIPRFAA